MKKKRLRSVLNSKDVCFYPTLERYIFTKDMKGTLSRIVEVFPNKSLLLYARSNYGIKRFVFAKSSRRVHPYIFSMGEMRGEDYSDHIAVYITLIDGAVVKRDSPFSCAIIKSPFSYYVIERS